jgi:hypothetical protein
MHAHLDEVDTGAEMLALISSIGETVPTGNCEDLWITAADVPIFGGYSAVCYYSANTTDRPIGKSTARPVLAPARPVLGTARPVLGPARPVLGPARPVFTRIHTLGRYRGL